MMPPDRAGAEKARIGGMGEDANPWERADQGRQRHDMVKMPVSAHDGGNIEPIGVEICYNRSGLASGIDERHAAVADGHAVCRRSHADEIAARGLRLTGIWGEGVFRFSAAEAVPEGGSYDDIFITAKSLDPEAICRSFADAMAGHEVVSLQNGIGNEEIDRKSVV